MISIIFYTVLILGINLLIKTKNFLPNYSGNNHQMFANEANIPLSGGIYILIILTMLFFQQIYLIIFFLMIFFIGFAGDKNFLVSPTKRLILQILTVVSFVYYFDLTISNTRIDFFDQILDYKLLSYAFASFCILVLINGSNFIDGLNSLLLGYFLIVLYMIFRLELLNQVGLDQNNIKFLFFTLMILILFNYFNLFFLGDSGSYLVGLFLSFLLITIYNLNLERVSPYFIIVLIWYPCFENLFSIIRKNTKGISPTYADHNHLHQLIFVFFQQFISIKKKYLNSIVSFLINLFNFIVLYNASNYSNNSIFQVGALVFCITTYLTIYFYLNSSLSSTLIKK